MILFLVQEYKVLDIKHKVSKEVTENIVNVLFPNTAEIDQRLVLEEYNRVQICCEEYLVSFNVGFVFLRGKVCCMEDVKN